MNELTRLRHQSFRSGFAAPFIVMLMVVICAPRSNAQESDSESTLLADEQIEGDYEYKEFEDGVVITGFNGEGEATIPSTLAGKPVVRIGTQAFAFNDDLTSLTIPDSVTSIGNYAFEDCERLASVTIEGDPEIGYAAFRGCPWQPEE